MVRNHGRCPSRPIRMREMATALKRTECNFGSSAPQTMATAAGRPHPDERTLLKTTGQLQHKRASHRYLNSLHYRQDRRDEASRGRGDGESNPGSNLHVSGLASRTTDDDLYEVFGKFGKVSKSDIRQSRQ